MTNLPTPRTAVLISAIKASDHMNLRALSLLLLLGCNTAFAGIFSDDEARKQINDLTVRERTLQTRITKLEEIIDSQLLLKLHGEIEALKLEINKLHGQIEVLANENAQIQKRQKDFYVDLDNRLQQLEKTGVPATTEPGSATPPSSATTTSNAVSTVSPAENQAYEAAYNQFKAGDYQGSIARFKVFIKNHPKSDLVPSAHYWTGNAYYALRDFKSAIFVQKKLVSTFPDSTKNPDALLNVASSQSEMNRHTDARKTLEDLINRYPASDAAGKARQRLQAGKK